MGTDVLAHRKNSVDIQFTTRQGVPLARKPMTVRQISHEFLFGCGAFESLHVVNPSSERDFRFFSERLRLWLRLFNFGTLPFYWNQFEPEQGKTISSQVKAAAKWLKEKKVTLKGHPLCWHTGTAEWLLPLSNEEILELQLQRIIREVHDFSGLIDMWDVINEVVIMPEFDKYDNGITRICKEYGRVGLIKQVFEAARTTNPHAVLLLNDFNVSQRYASLIRECLDHGVPMDVIGVQSHQHQGYWGDEKLYEVLERFSQFCLPIHFTENTFISGELMPGHIVDLNDYRVDEWPTEPQYEERQARNVENFYRILFACPSVEAITTWAFQDNAWLHAPAGLVRVDNSVKPAYFVLDKLINEEWMTKLETVTDDKGRVSFSGFKGRYSVRFGAEEFEFESSTASHIFQLG